jgi:hypothetical protein
MMLGPPDGIKSERFGQISHRNLVAVDLIVADWTTDVLKERRHTDMHGVVLLHEGKRY